MEELELEQLKIGDKIKTINGVEFIKVGTNDGKHSILATVTLAGFSGTDKKTDYKCIDYGISLYRQWLNSDKENNCFSENYPGQLKEENQNIHGFLYDLPKELKNKLDVFDRVQYLKRVDNHWETDYIINKDKVCMASLYELGCTSANSSLGTLYGYFENNQNKMNFFNARSVITRTPRDNDTYCEYGYNNEKKEFKISWGFVTRSVYLVALLNVRNDLIINKKDDGTYVIYQNTVPAKITLKSTTKDGIYADITGTSLYIYKTFINGNEVQGGMFQGSSINTKVADFNEPTQAEYKKCDVMNIKIEVACMENKSIKTVKNIRYTKNTHNIDKVKRFYLNGKTYDVKNITVDNTGLVTLELENYHDEAVKDNVIFVIDGKYSIDCVSNLNGQEEKLECNYLSSKQHTWILEDKYEIPVKNANNNFKITLNCEGLYDKQDIISGVMAAFKYYSE